MDFSKVLLIGINLSDTGSTGVMMRNALEYAHITAGFSYAMIVPKTKRENCFAFQTSGQSSFYERLFYRFVVRKKRVAEGLYYHSNAQRVINIIEGLRAQYAKIIIHLHNLHQCELHYIDLLKYFYKHGDIVLYTLHDCWSFTGGCFYLGDGVCNCEKWMGTCSRCPLHLPGTKGALRKKVRYINKLNDKLVLMPCSEWLANMVRQSRIRCSTIKVLNGETGMSIRPQLPGLKSKLGIPNSNKVLISVAAFWNTRRGSEYIYRVADLLPNDYTMIIIGNHFEDKKNNKVIVLPSMDNDEVSSFLQIADCYLSVTQCDNLPLVLMEAQLCGVPVVGFGHGGTPETITSKSGIMVGKENNIEKLVSAVRYVVENQPFAREDIVSSGRRFAKYEYAKRVLPIYLEYASK